MAATRPDVTIPAATWVNLYTGSGVAVGTPVTVYNKGSSACNLAVSTAAPASSLTGVPLFVGSVGSMASIDAGETGLWAYSDLGTRLLVQE